jgi:hypothetical protein
MPVAKHRRRVETGLGHEQSLQAQAKKGNNEYRGTDGENKAVASRRLRLRPCHQPLLRYSELLHLPLLRESRCTFFTCSVLELQCLCQRLLGWSRLLFLLIYQRIETITRAQRRRRDERT